jgi:lysozyme
MNSFSLSFDDTQFIRDQEGFSATAYPDPISKGEPYTIAWGLTGSWVTPGLTLTEDEAEEKFMDRISSVLESMEPLITVSLRQKQLIALTSFVWNLGIGSFARSTLLKKLNTGDTQGAANGFLPWNMANGHAVAALTNRRERERELFLS